MIAVTSALMGMQSIGTGILAELIVRTHFESQRKTSYAIAARVGFPPRAARNATRLRPHVRHRGIHRAQRPTRPRCRACCAHRPPRP